MPLITAQMIPTALHVRAVRGQSSEETHTDPWGRSQRVCVCVCGRERERNAPSVQWSPTTSHSTCTGWSSGHCKQLFRDL